MEEKLLSGWKGDIAFLLISIVVVFALHNGLKIALHTDSPLVIVISGSMEPTFYRGDVVLLEGVPPSEIKVGDVVVYRRPYTRYPIIHRVRDIIEYNGKRCFVIQGDNNWIHDFYPLDIKEFPYLKDYIGLAEGDLLPCIPQEAIEAKALLVFPKIGYPPLLVREKLGLG